jgi:transcriptional regulator with XRE-family HTH domain
MPNEDKEKVPVDKTSSNIRFLRQGVGLSISGLASLIEIDPISLYQYEKADYQIDKFQEDRDDLIAIANYFAVKLDDLIYTDIEEVKVVEDEWFLQLKNEITLGHKANRERFYQEVIEDIEELPEDVSREDILRKMLRQMHQLNKLKNRYYNLRAKGLIDEIDFFE